VFLELVAPRSVALYALVGLWSGFKFMVGVVLALGLQFDFWERFLATTIGGTVGVIIFTYAGDAIRNFFSRLRKKNSVAKPVAAWKKRIRDKFGIIGIAVLIPPLLSPPIGVALALGLGANRRLLLIYGVISIWLWGLLLAYIGELPIRSLIEKL
jgi:hypothetical protein